MRNLLFTLFALLTFTLPADELPLPAEKWSLFANSSIEDRVGNDTLPSGFWYGVFPEREPGRGSVVFLRAENRYSSAIYDIALFPPVPGSYRLKGRVRFLGGEECLQIGGTWHLKAEQQPGQKAVTASQRMAESAIGRLIGIQLPHLELSSERDYIPEHQALFNRTIRN